MKLVKQVKTRYCLFVWVYSGSPTQPNLVSMRPTLLRTNSICWVDGGDPCRAAELCISGSATYTIRIPIRRIGGHHFLLCQQTNTKDIAGQSAYIVWALLCWAPPLSKLSAPPSWLFCHGLHCYCQIELAVVSGDPCGKNYLPRPVRSLVRTFRLHFVSRPTFLPCEG